MVEESEDGTQLFLTVKMQRCLSATVLALRMQLRVRRLEWKRRDEKPRFVLRQQLLALRLIAGYTAVIHETSHGGRQQEQQ